MQCFGMRIDHLVWWCADLAEGERRFTEWLGVAPAFGGVHPGEAAYVTGATLTIDGAESIASAAWMLA